jgi:hypothetical protein
VTKRPIDVIRIINIICAAGKIKIWGVRVAFQPIRPVAGLGLAMSVKTAKVAKTARAVNAGKIIPLDGDETRQL